MIRRFGHLITADAEEAVRVAAALHLALTRTATAGIKRDYLIIEDPAP